MPGSPGSSPQGGQGRARLPGPTVPVYVISVAAELTGLHPQTLRQYDRAGLVSPGRTGGGGRRYSLRDIELLREIADLTSTGIGLEGVRRILELENQVTALRGRNRELRHRVTELQTALEATLNSLQDRRPNLPVLRPSNPISPFRDPR
jgi:MerR family transcriptional regulator/heat shock protein HspR